MARESEDDTLEEEEGQEADLPAEGSTEDAGSWGSVPALPGARINPIDAAYDSAKPLDLPTPTKPNGSVSYADYGRTVLAGVGDVARFTGKGVEYALGRTGPGDWLIEQGKGLSDYEESQMSDIARQRQGGIFNSDDKLSSIGLMTARSAPSAIVSAALGIGGGMGAAAFTTSKAIQYMVSFAASVGVGGVPQSIGQVYDQISEGIAGAKEDALRKESPEYVKLRETMDDVTARVQLQREMAKFYPLIAGAVTAVTSKYGIDGMIANKIAGNTLAGGVLKGALKGAAGEGFQETIENAAQEYLAQRALVEAGKQKDYDWGKITTQGLEGGIVGGLLGGATGAVLHREHGQDKPPPGPPPEKVDSAQAAALAATAPDTPSPQAGGPTADQSTAVDEEGDEPNVYDREDLKDFLKSPGMSTPGGTGVEAPQPAQGPAPDKGGGVKVPTPGPNGVDPTIGAALAAVPSNAPVALPEQQATPVAPVEPTVASPLGVAPTTPAPVAQAPQTTPTSSPVQDAMPLEPQAPAPVSPPMVQEQAPVTLPEQPAPVSPTAEVAPATVEPVAAGETATAPAAATLHGEVLPATQEHPLSRQVRDTATLEHENLRELNPGLFDQALNDTIEEMQPQLEQHGHEIQKLLNRGTTDARENPFVKALGEKIAQRMDELQGQTQVAEKEQGAKELDRAQQAQAERIVPRRRTQKVDAEAKVESDRAFERHARKVVEKEGENAPPALKRAVEAANERKAAGRGVGDAKAKAARAAANEKFRAARAERDAALSDKTRQEAAQKAREEKIATAQDEHTKNEGIAKKAIAENAPGKDVDVRKGEHPGALVARIGNMLSQARKEGLSLPDEMSKDHPAAVNFLVYAKKMMGRVAKGSVNASYDLAGNELLMRSGAEQTFIEGTIGDGPIPHQIDKFEDVDKLLNQETGRMIPSKRHDLVKGWEHVEAGAPRQSQRGVKNLRDALPKALAEQDAAVGAPPAVIKQIRDYIVKHVLKLIGDTPVYFTSHDELTRLTGLPSSGRSVGGAYGAGSGRIIMNDEISSQVAGQFMLHEAVHAATVIAIENNVNGITNALTDLMKFVQSQVAETHRDHYGFTNVKEFVAEALANSGFQAMLANVTLPGKYANVLQGKLTAWDHFVSLIGRGLNAVGFGRQGMTALEAILRMAPYASLTQAEQDLHREPDMIKAREALTASAQPGMVSESDPMGVYPMLHAVVQAKEAAIQRVKPSLQLRSHARKVTDYAKFTGQLLRESRDYFKGFLPGGNPIEKLGNLWIKMGPEVTAFRRTGDEIMTALHRYANKTNSVAAEGMSDVLYNGTVHGYDPTVPLSHANNKSIPQGGLRGMQRRALHTRDHAIWNSLPQDAKDIGVKLVKFYKDAQHESARVNLTNIIDGLKDESSINLPAGETTASAVKWVLDGGLDITQNNRSTHDQAMVDGLGTFGKMISNSTNLLPTKGVFVPLNREGDWLLRAQIKMATPAGAMRVGNKLFFKDEKSAQAYLDKSTAKQKVGFIYVDPATGAKLKYKTDLDTSERRPVVNVDLNHVESFKTADEAMAWKKKALADQTFDSITDLVKWDKLTPGHEIVPGQLRAQLNSLDQIMKDGPTKELAKKVIIESAFRNMKGTRIQQHSLPRRGIAGYSRDLVSALNAYNTSMGNYIVNMKHAREIAALREELEKYNEVNKSSGDDFASVRRQEIYNELQARMNNARDYFNSNALNKLTTMSFLTYMASPAASLVNSTQVAMFSMPFLAGKAGVGRASKEIVRAYSAIGGLREAYGGLVDTAHAARDLFGGSANKPVHSEERIAKRLEKQPDWSGWLEPMVKEAQARNYVGDLAGLEIEAAEIGKTGFDLALHRIVNVVRAMPHVVEAINRLTTGVAAVRIGRDLGMSQSQAVIYAMDAIEATQGDYGPRGAGRVFQSPAARVLLQFRKYGVLGEQFITRAISQGFRGATPQARKEGFKQLAALALVTGAMAGASGLWWEIPKAIVTAMWLAGKSEDWDQLGADVYAKLKTFFPDNPITDAAAEAFMYGLPRLVGVALSSRVGLDNLLLFGQPKEAKSNDTKAWLFDTIAGAPTSAIADTWKAVAAGLSGEYADAAKELPFPKIIRDTLKAVQGYTEGKVSATGKQLAPQYTVPEALEQAFGLTPASRVRQFEAGGSGREYLEDKSEKQDRTKMMNGWIKATGPAREEQWRTIRSWNKSHEDNEITMDALRKLEAKRRKENAQSRRDQGMPA